MAEIMVRNRWQAGRYCPCPRLPPVRAECRRPQRPPIRPGADIATLLVHVAVLLPVGGLPALLDLQRGDKWCWQRDRAAAALRLRGADVWPVRTDSDGLADRQRSAVQVDILPA